MHHTTKTIMVITILLVFTITAAIIIGSAQNSITGAVTAKPCECKIDSDCNDNNPLTTDVCLYSDSCQDSLCIHRR